MLKGSSSGSKKSSGSSGKSTGVRLSGSYGSSYGGVKSSSSKSSGSSKSSASKSSGGSWTSGNLNGVSSNKTGSYGGSGSSGSGGSKSSSGSYGGSGVKLSGNYGGSGGFSTPIPAGAKKVTVGGQSKAGSGSTSSPSVLGAYTNQVSGQKTGGSNIPRYELPGFHAIDTSNSSGLIKGWNGGKLVNGVIKYPTTANVDPGKAARAQAFVDYSYGKSTSGNSKMGSIYGQAYYDELERLANLPVGAPAWGSGQTGKKTEREHMGGGSGGGFGGSGGGFGNQDYSDALRAAQEAAAEALRQQVEMGVNDIYAQKGPLEEQMRKAAQQMYIANMQGKKDLPQQLAAQGITGGATESANLALETRFGDGLNGLLEYYNQAIAQLNRDAANLRASGNLQQAQNAADFASQLAKFAYETQQRLMEIQGQKELAAYRAAL